MWVLRRKRTTKGEVSRYKERLVIYGKYDHETVAHTFSTVVEFAVV